jgi:hypothetical protein
MTTDGGKTWQKVLYIDEQHGVSDLEIDPVNPNILYAGMWRFERKPWTHTSGSEQGGVFKSTDGGRTWRKLTNGLPQLMGRIGVKVAPSNPNIVYVIAESNDGTLFRSSTDRGESFERVFSETSIVSRGFYYTDLRVCPSDPNRLYFLATQLRASIDGGRTTYQMAQTVHVDHHALWIDPTNPNVLWNGNDGGLAFSLESRRRLGRWSPISRWRSSIRYTAAQRRPSIRWRADCRTTAVGSAGRATRRVALSTNTGAWSASATASTV